MPLATRAAAALDVLYEQCVRRAPLGSAACLGLVDWMRLGWLSREFAAARRAVDAERTRTNTGYPIERRLRELLAAENVPASTRDAIIAGLRATPRLVATGSAVMQAVTEGRLFRGCEDFDIFTDMRDGEVFSSDADVFTPTTELPVPTEVAAIWYGHGIVPVASLHGSVEIHTDAVANVMTSVTSYASLVADGNGKSYKLNVSYNRALNDKDCVAVLSATFDLQFCAVFVWFDDDDDDDGWHFVAGHPTAVLARRALRARASTCRVQKYRARGFTVVDDDEPLKKRKRDGDE